MQRLFILALAFIVALGAALGVFLYVSLVPFVHQVGMATAGLVILGIVCVATLMVTFTYSKVGILLAHRRREKSNERVIAVGEVVAYLAPDGSFVHLSAMHEAAKIPQQVVEALPPPEEDERPVDESLIIEFREKGMKLEDIAKRLDTTYYRVQRVTSEYDKLKKAKKMKLAN